MSQKSYSFHSPHDVTLVAELLRQSIDPEAKSFFTMSVHKGNRPLVGEVGTDAFRMRKTRNYRNDFASSMHGQFQRVSGGTKIHTQINSPLGSRLFMRFWLFGAVILSVPIFVLTVREIMSGASKTDSNVWVGLIVPPVLILFGIALPKFGQSLGRDDEEFFIRHIERTLSARIEQRDS